MTYDDLLTILRADYGWDVLPAHEVVEPYWPVVEQAMKAALAARNL